MDGLDELMAQLEADKTKVTSAASPKARVKANVANPMSAAPAAKSHAPSGTLTPRRAAVVSKLDRLLLDLADPEVRDTLQAALTPQGTEGALSQEEVFQYYLARPELSRYTLETELSRMSYVVVPIEGEGSSVSSAHDIQALYAADADKRQKGEVRGPEVLWRMANQSVFASALEAVHKHVLVPHDNGGTLCLSATTVAAQFRIDLGNGTLQASCDLSLGTIGSAGGRLTLAAVSLIVEASVSSDGRKCLRLSQQVGTLRPEVVFDEQLAATAAVLAELSPEAAELQMQGEEPGDEGASEQTFAGVRAAAALGGATASAFGALGAAASWGLKRALSSGGSGGTAEAGTGDFNHLLDRLSANSASAGGYGGSFGNSGASKDGTACSQALPESTRGPSTSKDGTARSQALPESTAGEFDDLFDSLESPKQ